MVDDITEEKLQLEISKEIPDSIKNQLEPGDMLVRARSLNKKFLPEPWFTKLAKDSVNNRLLWRHRDPEDKEARGNVYGRSLLTQVDGDFHDTFYRVFGGPEGSPEDNMQKLIRLRLEQNDPIGISKGFLKKLNKNGEITRVIALEDSITYAPECKACKTQEVLLEQMDEETKKQIEKLEKDLNDAKLQLESKSKTLEAKDKELAETKKTFTAKLEEFEAKITSKDAEKETLEDKLVKLSDDFKTFKLKSEQEKKDPIIDEIYKLEKDDDLKTIYPTWDMKKLEERLVKKKKEVDSAHIITKTLEKERLEAQDDLKTKDVGMKALGQLSEADRVFALAVENQMKAEGSIK